MLIEITKPKLNFLTITNDKYYYDEITKEYFLLTQYNEKLYFNLNGNIHRESGYAIYSIKHNYNKHFFLNNKEYSDYYFAIKTNHLTCKYCYKFCKQKCF